MSLKIWLPLTGDLHNQGASDLEFSTVSTNTSVNTSGKIGSCYYNNSNTAGGLISNKTIDLTTNQSMFCWFKFDSLMSNSSLGGSLISQHRHSSNRGMGITIRYVSSTTGYLSVNTGNGSSRTYNTYYGTTLLQANTWYHGGYTYDGSNIRIYVNGVCEKTQAFTGMSVPADRIMVFCWSFADASSTSPHGNYKLKGYINDVRVYDHCLSAAEVHEISQGLVLHYKLNGFQGGYGNPNVIVTHSNAGIDGTGTSGWSSAGTGWSNSFVSATGATGGYAIRCTYANTSQTSGGIHHPTGVDKTTLTTGDIYTLSARIRTSKACVVTFQNELMTTGHTINTTMDWQVYTYTCAIDTSKTYQSNVMYVRAADAVQNMWIECDWIKLEKGTAATPWQPSGVIGTAIQDSSGYGHNGIHAGNGTLISDTPRYTSAFSFNGAINNRIYCNDTAMNFTDNFSFATWMRANYTGTTAQFLFTVGRADAGGYGYGLQNSADSTVRVRFGNLAYDITITKNTWTHIAFTKSGTTLKTYKNGTLVNTYTFSGTLPTYSDGKGLGIGCFHYASGDIYPSYGAMSDFRIYATPLSADDIKQLYELGAKIDNKGNLHTYEINESSSQPKLLKTGVFKQQFFGESKLLNNIDSISYKPAANAQNSCSSFVTLDLEQFAEISQPLTLKISYTAAWTNFKAGTGGTFSIRLHCQNLRKDTNAWAWEGTLYLSGNFTSNVNANANNSVNQEFETTIPASYFNTYKGQRVRFRCDYSDGNGTITLSNIKVMVKPNICKIKSKTILADNLIEF